MEKVELSDCKFHISNIYIDDPLSLWEVRIKVQNECHARGCPIFLLLKSPTRVCGIPVAEFPQLSYSQEVHIRTHVIDPQEVENRAIVQAQPVESSYVSAAESVSKSL
jgi:hypothetical protein